MSDMEKLKKLKQLYESGAITKDEFDEHRLKIINRMTGAPAQAPRASTQAPRASAQVQPKQAERETAVRKPSPKPQPVVDDDDFDSSLRELEEELSSAPRQSSQPSQRGGASGGGGGRAVRSAEPDLDAELAALEAEMFDDDRMSSATTTQRQTSVARQSVQQPVKKNSGNGGVRQSVQPSQQQQQQQQQVRQSVQPAQQQQQVRQSVQQPKKKEEEVRKTGKPALDIEPGAELVEELRAVRHGQRKERAADECWDCGERLYGQVAGTGGHNYHLKCFVCHVCRMSLVGKTFYPDGEDVACANHVGQGSEGECGKCGNSIPDEYVEADGVRYHEGCFVCAYAGCGLDSGWMKGPDGEPYCFSHYQLMTNSMCVECNKMITRDCVTFKGQKLHQRCFVCAFCQNPIGKGRFYEFDDKPFCFECHKNLHYAESQ